MPIEPTLAEVIESAIDSRLLDLHTCLPGRVVAYDAVTQTATVQPVIMGAAPTLEGTTISETLPSIPNVPVRWERAGGYYEHKPLQSDHGAGAPNGDHGWLIFNEGAIARWRCTMYTQPEGAASAQERTRLIFPPGDLTRHSLSYPFFLPGAWPDDKPLPDAPTNHAVSVVTNYLRVSKANSTTADFVALSAKVQAVVQGILDAINNAVPAAGASDGGAALLTSIKGGLAGLSSNVAATSLKVD